MTTSNYMPDVKVEIAFNAGYSTPATSRTWTDVSSYVDLDQRIEIGLGRPDEFGVCDPNDLKLTLENTDGRFTAGKVTGAYFPNVKIGRPIRVTATPVGGAPSVRFLGYVDEWPVTWDGSDASASAAISASSRLARLGFDAELKGTLAEVVAGLGPLVYYPLNEPASSEVASDVTGNTSALRVIPNTEPLTFGAPSGLAGPDTAVQFNSVQVVGTTYTDGQVLQGILPAGVTGSSTFTVGCFVQHTMAGHDEVGHIFSVTDPVTGAEVSLSWLRIGSDRQIIANYDFGGGLGNLGSAVSATPWDDNTHYVEVQLDLQPSVTSLTLFIDGALEGYNDNPFSPSPDRSFTKITVGPGPIDSNPATLPVVVSNVIIGFSVLGVTMYEAATTGYADETAGERIERYATFAGIDPAEVVADSDTQPVAFIDTTGKSVIDAMRIVETTEGGVLFDDRDGTLTFLGRTVRYDEVSDFTLDAVEQHVETGLTPKLDRSALINDVSTTAADGSVSRATNQASIDDYGYARQTRDVAASALSAQALASWLVNTYGEPQPRIPNLSIDFLPLSATLQAAIFAARPSTRFTLDNLPDQATAPSVDFFIEGITESIDAESYRFQFNVSPTTGFDVWTIEDPVLGQYDAHPIAY